MPTILNPQFRKQCISMLASWLLCVCSAQAQQPPTRATITPNYKDADLAQITEAVSAVTGGSGDYAVFDTDVAECLL